jgi:hypothetical protein
MTTTDPVGEASSKGVAMGPAGDGGNNRVVAAKDLVGEVGSRTTTTDPGGEAGSKGAAMDLVGDGASSSRVVALGLVGEARAQDRWAGSSE